MSLTTSGAVLNPIPDANARTSGTPSERLAFVDLLRGIAILGVVLVHSRYYWYADIPPWFRTLANLGRYGVDLFFIVSAFTLARTCIKRPLGEFVLRRWLRIAPVYYLGILIYAVLPWLLNWSPAPPAGLIAANLTFLNGWWPGQSSTLVPGGWSISAEIAFYCLLPWAAKAVTSLWRAIIAYGAVLFATQFLGHWITETLMANGLQAQSLADFNEYNPLWHLPTFALGLILYSARQRVSPKWGWVLFVIGIAGFCAIPFTIGSWHLPRSLAAGVPLFAFALGVSAISGELQALPWKVLRWLGTISYSIYLMHFWVLEATVVIVIAMMVPLGMNSMHMFIATFLATLLLSAGVAALSRRYIEEPSLLLASRLCSPPVRPIQPRG